MTIFDEPEEHTIASHFLSALINGDNSGLDDQDDASFDAWLQSAQSERSGHWSYPDEEEFDNFHHCEITCLFSDCTTVTFHPIKPDA
jgi:hypothetical protein